MVTGLKMIIRFKAFLATSDVNFVDFEADSLLLGSRESLQECWYTRSIRAITTYTFNTHQ
jgi:hypothetical protein